MPPRSRCFWRPTTWSTRSCSEPRFYKTLPQSRPARKLFVFRLIDVDNKPHLRMDGAEHLEITCCRKGDVGPAARLLVPGVEGEFRRINIGVVQKIAIVVDDLQGVAALDTDLARMELASLLRNGIGRHSHSDQRSGRDHDG